MLSLALVVHRWTNPPYVADQMHVQEANWQGYLEVDRSVLNFPWECTQARWQVTGALTAYINGEETTLEGEAKVCPGWYEGMRFNPTAFVARLTVSTGQFQTLHLGWVRSYDPLVWIGVLMALLSSGALLALPPIRIRQRLMSLLEEGRFIAVMSAALLILNGLGMLALMDVLSRENSPRAWLVGSAWLILSLGLAHPGLRAWIGHRMRSRWGVIASFVWVVGFVVLLDKLINRAETPLLWSMVRTWQATVYLWGLLYWWVQWSRQAFDFRQMTRVRAWFGLSLAALSMGFISLIFNYVRPIYTDSLIYVMPDTTEFVLRGADQNPDTSIYLKYAREFPYELRGQDRVLHRTVAYIFTSQVCLVLDGIWGEGYVDGGNLCGSEEAVALSYYLMNTLMLLIGVLLLYEMFVYYGLRSHHAVYASVLFILNPINVWFLSTASTDYADVFITLVGLYIIHRLLSHAEIKWSDVVYLGLVLGLMLILKLFAVHYILLLVLGLAFGRSRAAIVVIGLSFLTLMGYRLAIESFGIAYKVLEAAPGWRSFSWLWTEWRFMTTYDQMRLLAVYFGRTMSMAFVLYGALFIPGIIGLSVTSDERHRCWSWVLWLALLSAFLWMFGFVYSYMTHPIIALPFIYGGLVLLLIQGQVWFSKRLTGRGLALASLVLWSAPPTLVIAQWFTWYARHAMYYHFF
ncbi:MAG: hypothetical protein NZ750_08995 [Anaerolineae bacterium]|nr:hypothetical protein [Anaerolineae bacterium]MDW8171754.1 hypothetical protein [Anaerolineae bacterium]